MGKLKHRTHKLTKTEQHHLLREAIPARIQIIKRYLSSRPLDFGQLTVAAIHSRAVANFLGIGFDNGQLKPNQFYHNHGGNQSWEVKIENIDQGAFVDVAKLPQTVRSALVIGFDVINKEFAHLTFWSDPVNQTVTGAPKDDYLVILHRKVLNFANAVVELFDQSTKNLNV